MTGAGKLLTIQRFVDSLNRDQLEKYGNSAKLIKLDERIAEQVAESEPGEDITGIYDDALRDVASQIKATFLDKWNAWRYMAMLVNPTTHIRNIVGNAIFMPVARMKDFTGAVLEKAFADESQRTKAIKIRKEYKDFAEKDAASPDVKNALANGGHYSENSSPQISDYQRVFKTRWLEATRKGNSNLLEAEDAFFKNIHYKHALAGFLQARHADLNNVSESLLFRYE